MSLLPIVVVSATTSTSQEFWMQTPLGRSLLLIPPAVRPATDIRFENTSERLWGLSQTYNAAIDASDEPAILLFVHDDVYLHDWFIGNRLNDATQRFDVVGVAGSVNPDLANPSWVHEVDGDLEVVRPQPGLEGSGVVGHHVGGMRLSVFGPAPKPCRLLDGLFLAARRDVLQRSGVRFDPDFAFHLYDLDLCRSAHAAGLRVGTWPIAVTHGSTGAFGTDTWKTQARRYLDKWADAE